MGLYCSEEDVKIRLIGKVRFTTDIDDENKFQEKLLRRLIQEAEGDVEQDLSPRFASPFQTIAGQPFDKLPQRPTREYLRTLCELKATIRVLETDFGRGGASDSENYVKSLQDRYDKMRDKIIEKEKEWKQWKYPPLPGLRLAYFNKEADDGYSGMVLTTGEAGSGNFPKKQINDPSQNFWNATLDCEEAP